MVVGGADHHYPKHFLSPAAGGESGRFRICQSGWEPQVPDLKITLKSPFPNKICPGKGAIMKRALPQAYQYLWKPFQKDYPLPKTNYQYEKRQKELDKKKKKAEKERLKEERKAVKPEENPVALPEK
jgi:hypothetical protein